MSTPEAVLSYASRRGGVWLVIAAIHVVVVYAICSWSPSVSLFASTPIEASIIEAVEPDDVVPPPPMPEMAAPTAPTIDPPLITIADEPAAPNAITVAVAESPTPPAEAAPRTVSDVAYLQPPSLKYPPESRRAGEEGLVVLRVLIDELGRASRIEIQRSSGYARLDAAARSAIERALFRPYVENGVPRMAFALVPVEFNWKAHSNRPRA
ncbi:MAG: energy transducer TonB [Gammaproteobacteria bacterium]